MNHSRKFDGTIKYLEVTDANQKVVCTFRGKLAKQMVLKSPKEAVNYSQSLYRAALKNEKLTIG